MTASRAKELLAAFWVGAFVLGFVLRIAGVDTDAGGWQVLGWVILGLLVFGGLAIAALWAREQRDAEGGMRRALAPWLWSLAAILAIGGIYALLLELL